MAQIWFKERDSEKEVGIKPETLRKMRRNSDHAKGWKSRVYGVDAKGNTKRRDIRWDKNYLNSLYQQSSLIIYQQ